MFNLQIIKSVFRFLGIAGILLLCLVSCDNNTSHVPSAKSGDGIWADTIIYEVLINNPDSLDEWESTKLKNVRHKEMVDEIFDLIYSGKKKAYHYYTNKPLKIAEVKELEADERYSRDRVGKLQFTETWHYDDKTGELKKQIHSILLAYELYTDSNEIRGYKAAFYITTIPH